MGKITVKKTDTPGTPKEGYESIFISLTGQPKKITSAGVESPLAGIADAPIDGTAYNRKDGAWERNVGVNLIEKSYSTNVDLSKVSSNNIVTLLTTPTSDGSGEAVHPSALYFKEKWNGYHYWMVITPYDGFNAELENPEILVSNDGANFIVPQGLTNPITPSPAGADYNFDPELVYDYINDVLWCFWGADIGSSGKLRASSTTDGITWTPFVEVFSSSTFWFISPSIVFEEGKFRLWYVEIVFADNIPRKMQYRESTEATSGWSAPVTMNVTFPAGKDLWHLSMRKLNEEYHAFFHVGTSGTSLSPIELYFGTSKDNLNYSRTSEPVIRFGQPNTADAYANYRGSAIYMPESNSYKYYTSVLDAGVVPSGTWRIAVCDILMDYDETDPFFDITTSQELHAIHNKAILKIKASVTLTIPFEKLPKDFICYFDVHAGFTLTISLAGGNTVTGNTGLTMAENKIAVLYKDGSTNNFRLLGDV